MSFTTARSFATREPDITSTTGAPTEAKAEGSRFALGYVAPIGCPRTPDVDHVMKEIPEIQLWHFGGIKSIPSRQSQAAKR
jgi:hypothetical protein